MSAFDDLFVSDVRSLVLGALDVRSLTALACASRALNEIVRADADVWRARADELDLREVPEGATFRECVLAGLALRVGDCLEVVDTFNLTSTARVHVILGPLLLIHFEGWEDVWFFWLHRVHDRGRIGPLTPRLPGTGAAGAYDAAVYRAQLEKAQACVAARVEWRAPSGKLMALWPWPYSRGRGAGREHASTFSAALAADWLGAQLEAPFAAQAAYAEDRPRCERAYRAATFWPEPLAMPEQLPPRIARMSLLPDGRIHLLPEPEREDEAGGAAEGEAGAAGVADAAEATPAGGAARAGGGDEAEREAEPSLRVAFAAFLRASAQLWDALVRSSQRSIGQVVGCGQSSSRRRV